MLIVFDHFPIGIRIRGTNSMEKLLAYTISHICLFTSFVDSIKNVFRKAQMFKFLFILFVIKQLLSNVTSDIDI